MKYFNVSFRIEDFCSLSKDDLIGKLSNRHVLHHSSLSSTQNEAWSKEYDDLHQILQGKSGRILFEYSIPGLPKTIDVVLLMEGVIFVIEYKANSINYNEQDKRQTNGYALRLKFFHSRSNDNWIVPILVATEAHDAPIDLKRSEADMVYEAITCNSANLKTVLNTVIAEIGSEGDKEWEEQWETGVFKASPTIIDAARNVWRSNNVVGFTKGEAEEGTRLKAEDYIVNTVVEETKQRNGGHGKSICFVTGVPGAGKTLVGLNVSVALQNVGASMLSGNGPLVSVLTAALKRDLNKYKKQLKNATNEISVESIIRGAYGYKKEIFEKRLDYHVGEGTVLLKDNAELSSLHVLIFDEAQRAWNKAKMIRPGQSGKKYWQEEMFPFSEPGILLWDMNQCDWGVFVCLVGGGQEIHTGEAGICEWLRTLEETPALKDWHIYMSDEFKGDIYNSKDGSGKTIEEYRTIFEKEKRLTISKDLHLTACQRSNRTEKVSSFIEELLNCDAEKCRRLYHDEIKDKYQIYLTRDIERAKAKLRERKAETLNKGYIDGKNDEEVRIGMLMSSKAARMRPLGYEIKKESQYKDKVPSWFLDSDDTVVSSDFLEIALNEFFVQGLELDFAAVMWDADLRYNEQKNEWNYYDFNDRYWSAVDKKEQELKRSYMKNAYRVLLTRARIGMVIFVPEGSLLDKTRAPEFYDSTYNYLKSIGIEEI